MIRALIIVYMAILLCDFILSYTVEWRRTSFGFWIQRMSNLVSDPIRKKIDWPEAPADFAPLIAMFFLFLIRLLW